MRKALHARVRPLVERFANQLSDLATARVEAELARIEESLEVALSTYESDGAPDLLTAAFGPELAAILDGGKRRTVKVDEPEPGMLRVREIEPEPRQVVDRDLKPDKVPQPNGRKPNTCSKCGFVGGNARGCGTAHPTQQPFEDAHRILEAAEACVVCEGPHDRNKHPGRKPAAASAAKPMTAIVPERRLKPTPAALELAKRRAAERNTERSAPPRHQAVEPDDVEGTAAEERWSPERITNEREHAEANKLEGELPRPRASFEVDPVDRVGGMAPVRELEPEDELDFGGADR